MCNGFYVEKNMDNEEYPENDIELPLDGYSCQSGLALIKAL